jgi:hypothetical protein
MSSRLSLLALAVSAGPVAAQGLISPGPSQPNQPGFFDPRGPRPVFTPVTPATALPPFGGSTAGGFISINRPVLYHPVSTPPFTSYPYSYSYLGTMNWYYAPPAPSTFLGLAPLIDPEAYPRTNGGPSGVRVAGSVAAQQATTGGVTVDLPATAELWVNGVKQPGEQASWDVNVPVSGPTTLALAAKWTAGGVKYEWNRTLPVGPGDHGRLLVVSGTAASAPPTAPAPRAK